MADCAAKFTRMPGRGSETVRGSAAKDGGGGVGGPEAAVPASPPKEGGCSDAVSGPEPQPASDGGVYKVTRFLGRYRNRFLVRWKGGSVGLVPERDVLDKEMLDSFLES